MLFRVFKCVTQLIRITYKDNKSAEIQSYLSSAKLDLTKELYNKITNENLNIEENSS
jgi:hypothetical protein